MKKVLLVLGFVVLSSCVSAPVSEDPPAMEFRTLRISAREGFAGFEYQWQVCVKKFLGICTKHEMRIEYYDLNDPQTKQTLIDMGFVLKVREKVVK